MRFSNIFTFTINPPYHPPSNIIKHNYQLHIHTPKDGIRGIQSNSFYYRSQKTWNELPNEVVNAKDINTFKTLIDKLWNNDPLKYDYRNASITRNS